MTQTEPCDKCGQKASCREVFRRLGEMQGKSVVRSVLTAFVLPLAVFIVVLAAAEQLLTGYIDSAGLRAVLALLSATAVTAISVTIVQIIRRWLGTKEKCRDKK